MLYMCRALYSMGPGVVYVSLWTVHPGPWCCICILGPCTAWTLMLYMCRAWVLMFYEYMFRAWFLMLYMCRAWSWCCICVGPCAAWALMLYTWRAFFLMLYNVYVYCVGPCTAWALMSAAMPHQSSTKRNSTSPCRSERYQWFRNGSAMILQ